MQAGALDLSSVVVPPEDGAVAQAIAELDTRLAAWTTAVADVQGRLEAAGAGTVEPSRANPAQARPSGSAAGGDAMPVGFAEDSAKAEAIAAHMKPPPVCATLAAQPDAAHTKGLDEELSEAEQAVLAPLQPAMVEVIRLRYRLFGGKKSIQELVFEEEEALLSSLEPETARAIRVQHRLFNGRKPVHELISEYEAEPTEDPSKKKVWWKRARA